MISNQSKTQQSPSISNLLDEDMNYSWLSISGAHKYYKYRKGHKFRKYRINIIIWELSGDCFYGSEFSEDLLELCGMLLKAVEGIV